MFLQNKLFFTHKFYKSDQETGSHFLLGFFCVDLMFVHFWTMSAAKIRF